MLKTIIFDFDGTIADSTLANIKIWYEIAPTLGFKNLPKIPAETIRDNRVEVFIKQLGIPKYKIFLALLMGKRRFLKILPSLKSHPGIKSALTELKRKGFNLGIITSNARANVEKFLQNNNLNEFDFVYSKMNLFGKDKVIKHFLKSNHIAPEDAVYIGDEARDIDAGHGAGIKVISVTWGYNSKRLLEKSGADFIVNEPGQLTNILEKL